MLFEILGTVHAPLLTAVIIIFSEKTCLKVVIITERSLVKKIFQYHFPNVFKLNIKKNSPFLRLFIRLRRVLT